MFEVTNFQTNGKWCIHTDGRIGISIEREELTCRNLFKGFRCLNGEGELVTADVKITGDKITEIGDQLDSGKCRNNRRAKDFY